MKLGGALPIVGDEQWVCPDCDDAVRGLTLPPEGPMRRCHGCRQVAALRRTRSSWDRWFCPRCDECLAAPSVPGGEDRYCEPCKRIRKEDARRSMPREQALALAKVPQRYRSGFDPARVGGGEWPRDPRRGFADYDLQQWSGTPSTIAITSPNGHGKSMLAGELLMQLHRAGWKPLYWTTTPMLLQEERDAQGPRPMFHAALEAQGLVIDEFTRGVTGQWWRVLEDLMERRHGRQTDRATIVLMNTPIKDLNDGDKGSAMVFDRLRDGLMMQLGGQSMRGRHE